ncbi:172_t:CDS:2 [Entrophospora sp. SA101]|nr:172_t:CDS:2 [Entrophospora sp. SA101]
MKEAAAPKRSYRSDYIIHSKGIIDHETPSSTTSVNILKREVSMTE